MNINAIAKGPIDLNVKVGNGMDASGQSEETDAKKVLLSFLQILDAICISIGGCVCQKHNTICICQVSSRVNLNQEGLNQ